MFAIAILAFLPGLTKANVYYYNARYRTRWSPYTHGLVQGNLKYSPYAKKFGNSGLVNYRLKYSPYAKKYGSSGLVYDNVRYSPYAFGFKRSGLIADPWGNTYNYHRSRGFHSTRPCIVVCHSTSESPRPSAGGSKSTCKRAKSNSRTKPAARLVKTERTTSCREKIRTADEYKNRDIISGFLNLKNINFRIDRTLSIENNLISVDFILTDKNIVIKYWNPENILALQKQKNPKMGLYESYLETYKDYAGQYLDSGGRIYQIITADSAEVLTKLLDLQKQFDEQQPCETANVTETGEDSTVVAMAR